MNKRLKFENLKSRQKLRPTKILVPENCLDTETSRFFQIDEEISERNETDNVHKFKNENKKIPLENVKISDCKEISELAACTLSVNKNFVDKFSNWFPSNWEQHLDNIRYMRRNHTAPVDTMGCQKCANQTADGPIFRFQVLLALILSSQTKDQITYSAMHRLREVTCTAKNIVSISDEELGKLIYPVSFWKRKVQYLKKTSQILLQKYNGDIPDNFQELSSLPGVGPKISHLCMQVAWNKTLGIGVDAHVHRISNRLKWVPKPTKTTEETRAALESWLPTEFWKDINNLFVGFGQEICRPRKPICLECKNKNICPYVADKYQF